MGRRKRLRCRRRAKGLQRRGAEHTKRVFLPPTKSLCALKTHIHTLHHARFNVRRRRRGEKARTLKELHREATWYPGRLLKKTEGTFCLLGIESTSVKE